MTFLNHHRPCLFPAEAINAKGRVRKRYRDSDVMTPYEKLKSLDNAEQHLKPGITFDELDALVLKNSGFKAAQAVARARNGLFKQIGKAIAAAA
ncbi:MAG: hypothetical protein OXF66_04530 [Gammaproteobacteria bacterium]|nr:hypothetical protein [Gammaproteobacteria bacterium]MCY4166016.1 hypothetical protein [Gammaproteobacteria bacterium]MCY4341198.1 hypothetical protein [Gammaproteobacteria bacterium]